ncbi:MAG: hypothetical protein ACJAS1_005540 [Oleiphilaceae bacterium]|jgi:hypothetical protein
MDNDEIIDVNAKIEYDKMAKLQKYRDEFEKLSPHRSVLIDSILGLLPFVLLMLANYFLDIESQLLQILFAITFVISTVQGTVIHESRKTNQRIDLLSEIVKKEIEQCKT